MALTFEENGVEEFEYLRRIAEEEGVGVSGVAKRLLTEAIARKARR